MTEPKRVEEKFLFPGALFFSVLYHTGFLLVS